MKPALPAAFIALLLATGCGGGSKSASTTTTRTLTTTNPTGTAGARFEYPKILRTSYTQSCLKSPRVTRAYCTCTLDKLSETVSTGDFQRIGLSGGQIPPRIKRLISQAAHACRGKL